MSAFFKEFKDLLSKHIHHSHELVLVADLNIHLNKPNEPDTAHLLDILDSMDLTQHINEPTHIKGNLLDVLITRKLKQSYKT